VFNVNFNVNYSIVVMSRDMNVTSKNTFYIISERHSTLGPESMLMQTI